MRNIFILILLAVFISSCQYRKTNKRHHYVQKQYSKKEPIIVKDAIICANVGALLNKKIEINRDSILFLFVNSLKKLPININFQQGNAHCSQTYIPNRSIKYHRLNFTELTSFTGNDTSTYLIPIINYDYVTLRNIYITSTGAVGGGGFSKSLNLGLGCIIFKKKELVYFKSRIFIASGIGVDDYLEPVNLGKQENIDTLVQLTMKDYLERMK